MLTLSLMGLYSYWHRPSAPQDVLFQLSQWPLSPSEPHVVMVLYRKHIVLQKIEVVDGSGQLVSVLETRALSPLMGWQASTMILPRLNTGNYTLQTADKKWQQKFVVADSSADEIINVTLQFFSEQRCGVKTESHATCHLKAPQSAGLNVERDVTGGWHDAGDYIRFFLTTSYATTLMLESVQWLKPHQQKSVVQQAAWGLRWLDKMWGAAEAPRYMQISDATDHDHWRLPEQDDGSDRVQKAYVFEAGKGANLAGRLSASMAIYSQHCEPGERSYWLQRAQDVFLQGQKMVQAAQSSQNNFYQEKSWQEDMALAALELSAVTQQKKYIQAAQKYLEQMPPFWAFGYDQIHPLIYLRLAQVLPQQRSEALGKMKRTLERNYKEYLKSKVFLAVPKLYWGSQLEVMGIAILALIYQKESGDVKYRQMALDHWDYTLGRNPWGLSFVSGIGREWLKTPHHQIADLKKTPLIGYWAPGAVHREVIDRQKINLDFKEDPLVERSHQEFFQSSDSKDYVTNEPTLTAAATGLFFVTMYFANLPGPEL